MFAAFTAFVESLNSDEKLAAVRFASFEIYQISETMRINFIVYTSLGQ
jgi:hypothetical protein